MNLAFLLTPLLVVVATGTDSTANASATRNVGTNDLIVAEVPPPDSGPAINEPEPPAPVTPAPENSDTAPPPELPGPDAAPQGNAETAPPPEPPATETAPQENPEAVPPPEPVAPETQALEPSEPAATPEPPVQSDLELNVKRRLYAELESNPKLQGAWIRVSIDPERQQFIFQPIYDAARVEQQEAEFQNLLKDILGDAQYTVEPHETLPVSAFTEELQGRIDGDLSMGGSRISGAYFRPTEGDGSLLELMLLGRVAHAEQRDSIVQMGIELRDSPAFADSMQAALVKPDAMAVVEPSSRVGAYLFDSGFNSFFRGKYPEALVAFNESILESPDRIEFRYWRVLTEIALDDMDSAAAHLDPLMHLLRNPSSDSVGSRQIVLESLERAQGPVRWELIRLEREKLLEGP